MKKISLFISVLILLTGCVSPNTSSPSIFDSEEIISESLLESDSVSESSQSDEITSETSESESEVESESESESETIIESETKEESESTKEESSEEEISEKDVIPSSGESLPIGNKTVSGPENLYNPVDINEWVNFDLSDSLPSYFSYIQGNNKVKNCSDFYALSAGGGFKFSHKYYGLQTPVFTPFIKVEVRLYISVVKNNSQAKDVDEPILHIYGYDEKGKYIYTDYIEQGSITKNSEGNYVRFYIRDINVCYFEIRLNAFPYKGSQCYNFGVNQISLKGWNYD